MRHRIILYIVFVVLALIVAVLTATGCTNEERARHTLEDAGFTGIVIDGWAPRSCGDSDGTCTAFTAINPTGRLVHGAVGCSRDLGCGGKGCTIRFDGR